MKASRQALTTSEEEVYYGDGSVWVTNRRLVYDRWKVPLSAIKSARVRVVTSKDEIKSSYLYLLSSPILLVVIWLNLSYPNPGAYPVLNYIIGGIIALVLAFAIAAPYIFAKASSFPVYAVSVGYHFWTLIAAASTDREYAEQIVKAIQYALARRDNSTAKIEKPAGISYASQIPMPYVRGNTLYANQAKYSLANIKSIYKWRISDSVGIVPLVSIILPLEQLASAGEKYFSSQKVLINTAALVIGLLVVIAFVGIAFFIPKNVRGPRKIYTVHINTYEKTRDIIFASTDSENTYKVQQSINEALQNARQGNYAEEATGL